MNKKIIIDNNLISRTSVLDVLKIYKVNLTVIDIIRGLPITNVAIPNKVGHWIDADGDNAICSCCNRLNHLYGTYCKHCGARMESEKNE